MTTTMIDETIDWDRCRWALASGMMLGFTCRRVCHDRTCTDGLKRMNVHDECSSFQVSLMPLNPIFPISGVVERIDDVGALYEFYRQGFKAISRLLFAALRKRLGLFGEKIGVTVDCLQRCESGSDIPGNVVAGILDQSDDEFGDL
ncbi:hypothetical protein F1559_004110 [Cyanidiococcus yangmingshanensis]|uniref:Uncharacterized protein n=1 Tax=Cyanidiococcus yangmingshanensis TaxID=2690220 RepID=A0A7J7IFE7_9RHOD|nr:hypothetical protein F1559_004110 [Cyanidiococcus yangmingshanensis]